MNKDEHNEIKQGIFEVMKTLALDRMPISQEVRMLKMNRLENLILRNGGYGHWAKELNLPSKRNDFLIHKKEIPMYIRQVVDKIGEDRMPSTEEIFTHFEHGNSLHNKICRNGGYRFWAEKLGLEMKESETQLGQDFEEIAIKMLIEKGHEVERMTTQHPFDLLVNGTIKVDIKSGRAYDLRGSRCHTFGLSKRFASCDLYLIFALSEESEIERTFVIPSHKLKIVTLSIGENSKYNKYIDRWDYLDQYDNFYKSIS